MSLYYRLNLLCHSVTSSFPPMNPFPQALSLFQILRDRGITLAVAESCTGGLVGAAMTSVPGSSAVFVGGVIAYSNDIKVRVLGVSRDILDKHGAVSGQCVEALARGAQRVFGADCAIAVSGIAGPDGGTIEKPVGLVWFGVAFRDEIRTSGHRFIGDRQKVREQAVERALLNLRELL